ncbi:MAG: fibronectin type III domain-containing protein [archaeon]|nr:fibronectin type III domain-containing protein [archaeon]
MACFLGVQAIPGPVVSSSTHPEQEKWYRDNSPKFDFELEGAVAYSYALDMNTGTLIDDVSEGSESTINFSNKTNGAWYFHVKARVGGEWTETSHYAANIDRTSPLPPTNLKLEAVDSSSIKLSWSPAVDSSSGIKGYKIYRALLTGFNITDSTTTVVVELAEGESYVDSGLNEGVYYHYKVQSIDNAGNLGGTSNEAISRTATQCDLVLVVEGTFDGDNFLLKAQTDDSLFGAYLKVTLPGADVNNVFSGISGKNEFSYPFDLSGAPEGRIEVDFGGVDREGDDCVAEKTFYFDTILPVVEWVFPQQRAALKDLVSLKASASDGGQNPSGIEKVEFFLEGESMGAGALSEGFFALDWNSLGVENKGYDLAVRAFDFAGNSAEAEVFVTVENTALLEAQANSLISEADSAKQVAVELKNKLDSMGASLESFQSLFGEGESKLLSATDALGKGVNFNRAVLDARASLEAFTGAVSSVDISKEDSVVFVFRESDIGKMFLQAGLKKDFSQEALGNFSAFSPRRRIDIFKVSDGNASFYRAAVFVSLSPSDSNFSGAVKVVEAVEKAFAASALDMTSMSEFSVLAQDPVLLFEVDVNGPREFSYFLKKNLSAKEVSALSSAKPNEFFAVPPVVLSSASTVPSDIFVKPVDLFAFFGSAFGGDIVFFGAVSIGVVLVVLFILAVVSIVVIAFIVMRTKRKGL